MKPAFNPQHIIDLPAISVKLNFTMKSGAAYEGTGFCVDHQERRWLITCRHNVEDREFDFTGENDLSRMTAMGECEIEFDSDRSVVGISVDGFIPDCAAIELKDGEWKGPKFGTDVQMTMEGHQVPEMIRLHAPGSETEMVNLQPTGWVFLQGFPGGSESPVTLRGARAVPLPKIIQPWMLTYLPASIEGFSGGPVLTVTNDRVSLLGITTHKFPAQFTVRMDDGRMAEIAVQASAGVPLAPLLWALERASAGNSVIVVRPPIPRT